MIPLTVSLLIQVFRHVLGNPFEKPHDGHDLLLIAVQQRPFDLFEARPFGVQFFLSIERSGSLHFQFWKFRFQPLDLVPCVFGFLLEGF